MPIGDEAELSAPRGPASVEHWEVALIWIATTVLSALAVYCAARALGYPHHGIDDAQIAFKYADNLARGNGFVFNPGGERVEGATSLAWTLICAALSRLGNQEGAAFVLGIAMMIVTVSLTASFAASMLPTITGRRWLAIASVWSWCLAAPGFVSWNSVALMDSALWTLVLTGGTLYFSKPTPGVRTARATALACAIVCTAVLTRPEAIAVVPLWLLLVIVDARLSGCRWRASISRTLGLALAYLLTLAALTAFRLAYFGYPLPNTYYAKVSSNWRYNLALGFEYLRSFGHDNPTAIVALACAVACVGLTPGQRTSGNSERQRLALGPALIGVSALLLPLATGGDHFDLYRFVQPIWPLLIIPPIAVTEHFAAKGRSRWLDLPVLGLGTLVVLGLTQLHSWKRLTDPEFIRREFRLAEDGLRCGRALNALWPTAIKPSVAEVAVGGIGRAYRGELVDLMGLNNVAMGHSKGDRRGEKDHAAFDPEIFLRLAPDLAMPRLVARDIGLEGAVRVARIGRLGVLDDEWLRWVLKGLPDSPRFREQYLAVVLVRDDPTTRVAVQAWCKRARLPQFQAAGLKVFPFRGQL